MQRVPADIVWGFMSNAWILLISSEMRWHIKINVASGGIRTHHYTLSPDPLTPRTHLIALVIAVVHRRFGWIEVNDAALGARPRCRIWSRIRTNQWWPFIVFGLLYKWDNGKYIIHSLVRGKRYEIIVIIVACLPLLFGRIVAHVSPSVSHDNRETMPLPMPAHMTR